MSKFEPQVTEFSLEGQVVHIFFEGCKPKYLQLMTANGIHLIKLSKECRAICERSLFPGQQIEVSGWRKVDLKAGKIKLKAELITLLSADPHSPARAQTSDCTGISAPLVSTGSSASSASNPATGSKKSKILICQKSDCRKRGGNRLYTAIEEALTDRGLQDQVKIQGTGCLKRCKAGPNIVFMPDKVSYSQVNPATVPNLIEKHLSEGLIR
ncbi:MAG: (2Fe-2S) ferredoxin domain-containing protein [Oscillatoriales cyanobacterium RM2_1_1]|nr:(2Fe-2S) ferredoxin domain-containing protein [Oscillatoriales cyanobacterium SM2_3_0]NJO47823.1 (2Fe-2S) ferredoxin domain-containing protein [Oscillatoriales cyanobacterium RM2_1_1]